MSDTPKTDALADQIEHLGSGGRLLYQGLLWRHARQLERELAEAAAALRAKDEEIARYKRISESGESLGGELEEREARIAAEQRAERLAGLLREACDYVVSCGDTELVERIDAEAS